MDETRKFRQTYDLMLLLLTMILLGMGLVMVFSASSELAQLKYNDSFHFVKRQCFAAALGIGIMIAVKRLPYQVYQRIVYPILGLSVVLLILTLVPGFSTPVKGASRWLRLGSLSFQPSEAAKLALVIYMAYSLDKKGEQVREFLGGFLPHFFVGGILIGLVLIQPDMGMAVILAALTGMMLFIGGAQIKHLALTGLAALPLAIYAIVGKQYRLDRLLTFLNPWEDPLQRGFQIIHSFFAVASGGLWGAGLGAGKQKLFYLPEPHTDFIFAVVAEELGFLGGCIMLILYCLLLYKIFQIAINARDRFGYYLGVGIAFMVGFPVMVHLGVVLGLLPTKGMTLPFMSYGGSSLLLNLTALGILLNIRCQSQVRPDK
jgi:cell division protein FtsW